MIAGFVAFGASMALILFYLWMEWPQRLADKIRKGVTDWMVNNAVQQ